jgi:hypothetical protein
LSTQAASEGAEMQWQNAKKGEAVLLALVVGVELKEAW